MAYELYLSLKKFLRLPGTLCKEHKTLTGGGCRLLYPSC